jgi:RNA polymerase sigma factor (sigma-70 family)
MGRAQLGDAIRQIQRLFSDGTLSGLSDASLLRQFVSSRDEEAFVALVARHGPMVLSVCQSVLRDRRDAEDAFQATFLVLVRRAHSLWIDESLGGWLHRVAHRVAVRANADVARRRKREGTEVEIDAIHSGNTDPINHNACELHEEIAR